MKKISKKASKLVMGSLFLSLFGALFLLSFLLINNQGAISSVPVTSNPPAISSQLTEEQEAAPVNEEYISISYPSLETFEKAEPQIDSSIEILNKETGISQNAVAKSGPVPVGPSDPNNGFVYANGTEFYINGKPFYFSGANNYYLRYADQDCIAYNPEGGCQREVLEDAQDIGFLALRTWGFTDGTYYWGSLQPSMGNYNEENFQKMDYLVKEASERNLKLIIPLVNNWNDYGGMCQYARWCSVPNSTYCSPFAEQGTLGAEVHDSFYTNACTRDAFKNYTAYLLNRTNIFTGIKYKDDPTILAWELANEPRAKSDPTGQVLDSWIDEMSSYIRSIDSNHMLSTGAEGFYLDKGLGWMYNGSEGTDFVSNHNHTNIDYASLHLYPDHWGMSYDNSVLWIEEHADDAHQILGKPVVLGEFNKLGAARDTYLNGWYNIIQNKSVNGNLIWELIDENYPWDPDFGINFPDSTSWPYIQGDAIYSRLKNFELSLSNSYPQLEQVSDFTVTEGDLITVIANATDADNDYLNYFISDAYHFNKDGNVFTWQTRHGDAGTYSIDLKVSDGLRESFESFGVTVLENTNCTIPYEGMVVSGSVSLCHGRYFVKQAISIDSDSTLDCNGSELYGNWTGYAIQISGDNSKVANCRFNNFSRGIQLLGASNITIENNHFDYYMYHGINTQNSEYIHVTNNTFTRNSDIGFYCYHSSNNLVEKNNFSISGKGVYFDGCTDTLIENNSFYRTSGDAILIGTGSSRNSIIGNNFTLNAISWQGSAITISSNSNYNEIKRNNIQSNFKGVQVYESNTINITDNNIYNNSYANLHIRGTNINATNNWWGTKSCYLINQSIINYSSVPKPEWQPILDDEYPYGLPTDCVAVECNTNLDCGLNGLLGNPFCQGNNVWDVYRSYFCQNPGTEQSKCTQSEISKVVEVCSDSCYKGECAVIECSSNSDCGTSGWLDLAYCSQGNVWDIFGNYSCINKGTPDSYCATDMASQLKEECYGLCQDGACDNDLDNDGFDLPYDCDDSNSSINPDAAEVCDSIDQNCNNKTDEKSCPDLIVYHYSLYNPKNPVAGDDLVFKIEVRNTGYSKAEGINWVLETNSSEQDQQAGGFSLDVLESIWIYPEFSYTSAGNYSPKFILDQEGSIREDDETNNEVVFSISVGGS